ncbi:MAG TPA: translocation/assembly module TamB domain-containing protein [Casimicrobiaceae bacterium]|nr:translocation/assembly module TamB domain-containing protein [Casimicrobiaceae bacterium]
MRTTAKVLTWGAGALLVLVVAIAALAVAALRTDRGHRLIETAVARATGNDVVVSELSGSLPDDVHVGRLELRDADGPWMTADDVTLHWTASQLLRKELAVALLRAARVELLRPPPVSGGSRGLPVRVDIDRLDLERVGIAAPIAAPTAAALKAQGELHAASLEQLDATLTVTRIDAPGDYRLRARSDASSIAAEFSVDEPALGLLSGLAKLPDLGAVSARVSIAGPRSAEAARFTLAAGELRARGQGTIDLVDQTANIDVTARAPAMSPRPDLAWKGVAFEGHVHGPFTRPDAEGQLRIDELEAGGVGVRTIRAEVHGDRGAVSLRASAERLRIPGPNPRLFEAAPLELRADARLDDPARPVTFTAAHPLISVQGRAETAGGLRGSATITAPSLAPLAAAGNVDLKGRATLAVQWKRQGETTDLRLAGTIAVTGGAQPLPALLGEAAKVDVAATLRADEIALERARIDGKALRVSAQGSSRRDRIDVAWTAGVTDLATLSESISGRLDARGRLQGQPENLELGAEANGELATHGFPRRPVRATVRLAGVPGSPSGTIAASATLDGAPLELAVALRRRRGGTLSGAIQHADWKSAHAEGSVELSPGDQLPQGRVALRIGRLDDLAPWLGQPLQGSLTADVDFMRTSGRERSRIDIEARSLDLGGTHVERLAVTGTVDQPTTAPVFDMKATADGIAVHGVTGNARIDIAGREKALKVALSSELRHAGAGDVPLRATATVDIPARAVSLATLQAQYKGRPVTLLAPAHLSLAEGFAVDRLRLGMERAVVEVSGRLSPSLDLAASLRNATPALAGAFVEDVNAQGTLQADARLTGTLDAPRGTVKITGSGLRMRSGSARALPAADVSASAELEGQSARIEVKLTAGTRARLDAAGRVPLAADGAFDLRARGTIDATLANPILEVNGRRAKGTIALDADVDGSLAEPRMHGSLRVSDGELQDYTLGAQLTKIDALLEATGDTARIARFTAHAGEGTVSATGTVGVFAPGRPVDVKIIARNAKPFATDLLTAALDADLVLSGAVERRVDVAGSVTIHRAEITIPKALPPAVAVLDVRRAGEAPPPPATPGPVLGLDIKVDAPSAVFVRGRGLDAETGGALQVTGTTAAPRVAGGFDLRRGTFDLGGATLKFTSGRVSFAGTGLSQKIDPTLDFAAETTYNDITARLAITGYADSPRIALTSTPELPQDEILARLLFGVSVKQLTPLQLAQIANAVATLTGVGGGGFNPLNAVQKSLGLDRLSAGSTPTGGTTVEAGRYVSDRVYVGAKQSTQGGTQAQVQVDLTKNLKLQATLGTGGTVPIQGATPDNDPGSSVGLSYQFEY